MAGEVAQCRGVAVDFVLHWQQGMEESKEQAQAKWRNRLLFLKNLRKQLFDVDFEECLKSTFLMIRAPRSTSETDAFTQWLDSHNRT